LVQAKTGARLRPPGEVAADVIIGDDAKGGVGAGRAEASPDEKANIRPAKESTTVGKLAWAES